MRNRDKTVVESNSFWSDMLVIEKLPDTLPAVKLDLKRKGFFKNIWSLIKSSIIKTKLYNNGTI